MCQKYKLNLIQLVITVSLFVAVGGCNGIRVGGYEHSDMSQSRYKSMIQAEAGRLANKNNLQDLRTAAELYGSIGQLEEMDHCVMKYFKKDSAMGKYLLIRADKIHAYYNSKPSRSTESNLQRHEDFKP